MRSRAAAKLVLAGGVVGFFMYDANKDGKSDLGLDASGPFIAFTDVFMDATAAKFMTFSFDAGSEDLSIVGSEVKIPNWPSSDAQVLVMFQ